MTRRLLDTDILSEIIKGKSRSVAKAAEAYLSEQGRLTTSAATLAEIVYGFRRMGREDRIVHFEASLITAEILPFDDAAARLAGRINADLERSGRPIGMPDVMIASIALKNGLPLVTGNMLHFEWVRSLGYELGIENWRGGWRSWSGLESACPAGTLSRPADRHAS
ncbi:MAG: PIN domain-containing protein [Polyangiaceae bacterium]|nr:PIN domain-containing protein [Polyangiaceae bacterium]